MQPVWRDSGDLLAGVRTKKMTHTETRRHGEEKMTENGIGTIVVDCAVKMHKRLGPGLLERVYETVLW